MVTKPRLLDLCCGPGGAALGYAELFDVTGVDIRPQPHYPFRFWQADALELDEWVLSAFDVIHASPPCQRYSSATVVRGRPDEHPDLIAPLRRKLQRSGRPWVIENVPGAPLREPVTICGRSLDIAVDGYLLRRHRLFESNVALEVPPCACYRGDGPTIGLYGGGNSTAPRLDGGGGRPALATTEQARKLIGHPTATGTSLRQAIPASYSALLSPQLLAEVQK